MPTLTLDLIDQSGIEQDGLLTRYRRRGAIDDIDVSDPQQALQRVKTFLESQGYGVGSDKDAPGGTKIRRFIIEPSSSGSCWVTLCYDSPEYGVTSAFYVTQRAYTTNFTTQYLPGSSRGVPIRTAFRRPGFAFSTGGPGVQEVSEVFVPADNITMTFLRSMLSISINAVIYGEPPANLESAINMVNKTKWRNKPPGYWRVTGLESTLAKYAGYYTYAAEVLTKVDEPWDELGTMHSSMTGKIMMVPPEDIKKLLAPDYKYGVFGIKGGQIIDVANVNWKDDPDGTKVGPDGGIIRVGPYGMINFADIFKFDGLG